MIAFITATVAASSGSLTVFIAGLAITLAVSAQLARERWLQSPRRER
ncbi:hypothetical protein [Streptomyces griseus]